MAVAHGTRIKIIPPFMRLHEWIALEERTRREHGAPGVALRVGRR